MYGKNLIPMEKLQNLPWGLCCTLHNISITYCDYFTNFLHCDFYHGQLLHVLHCTDTQVKEILQEEEDLSEIVQLVGKVMSIILCICMLLCTFVTCKCTGIMSM